MFDTIYKIALTATSRDDLDSKLKGMHIDARKKDNPFITVAAQLAIDGQIAIVKWLKQAGADASAIAYGYAFARNHERVNECRQYTLNAGCIAQGYALAGDHERVEMCRTKYGASANFIAYGYAFAGNHERVETYRTKYKADVNFIAQGYALAGNHERVEAYHTQYTADVSSIARGYALAGNHERVEAYRAKGACINDIAQNYAFAGNHEQVEVCRTQHGAEVNAIAYGYELAGNYQQAEVYRAQYGTDIVPLAQNSVLAGNHEQVEVCRTQHEADVNAIAYGSALAGNPGLQKKDSITLLLERYMKERAAVVDASGQTKEYFYGSFFAFFQKSFTQKSNAVSALQSALEGKDVDLSEHLSTLRNGWLGKELRALIKSGTANTLVNKDVNTVSDFVQALQEKISNKLQENSSI